MMMTAVPQKPTTENPSVLSADEIAVTNPKMEQFLWLVGIKYKRYYRTMDGMTAWVYARTPAFEYATRNFLSICDHVRAMPATV